MRSITPTILVAALAVGGATACGEAADEANEVINCAQICETYQDCVDSDLDVSDCTDRCEDRIDDDDDGRARAQMCEDCLDGRSCAEGVACTPDCAGLVP
ncbi:MAG: hypothetical protein H6704_14055 [Myxococcales bacterium]|nr:hypothetical protein [Myxococcales bacterium]